MKSKAKILVVLVAIVSLGLVIAACGGSQPAPTPVPPTPTPSITVEDLAGIWIKGCTYLQIRNDGTFHEGHRIDRLEEHPSDVGTFQLDGTSLTLITSEDSLFCSSGQTGSFEVELTQQGQLKLMAPKDECLVRGSGWSAGFWTRVSPTAAPVLPSPAATESAVTFPVTVTEDAVYAIALQPDVSPPEWRLDVYAPTEPGAWPVVVFVHGASERKVTGVGLSHAIAKRGAVVFTVDWPAMASVAITDNGRGYREMLETLACAIRFARARAPDYGGDAARVILVGFSLGGGAGAHIALVGDDLDRRWEEFAALRGGPPPQVDCAVSGVSAHVDAFVGIAGAYDAFVGTDGKYGREWLQERDPELWEMLNSSLGQNPDLEVRLIHGEDDPTSPFENSVVFDAALAEAGYDTELIPHDGYHEIPTELTVETIMEVARD